MNGMVDLLVGIFGWYYVSKADNRDIYQAMFSTKLLKWLEKNEQQLTKRLLA